MTSPLWTPTPEAKATTHLTRFMAQLQGDYACVFEDYEALHAWSVEHKEDFWRALCAYADVRVERWGEDVLVNPEAMPGATWFPDARLNYAENLLRRRDDGCALTFQCEDRAQWELSWSELYNEVSKLAQALRGLGVSPDDRVAAVLPNIPETIIAMLAVTSLGATWTSCSPDFGVQGVLDRFGQVEPRVLFVADGYAYNGKIRGCRAKAAAIAAALTTVEQVIEVPYLGDPEHDTANGVRLPELVAPYQAGEINFVQVPFNHPLYIMYSSGTTGAPKCIVHGVGGTLLQHLKEHLLHCDVRRDDRVFYFTTCGWMMWNWLVSGLACEATLVLYDGSPFYPDGNVLFDYADKSRMTLFGTSAKFIDAVKKSGLKPMESHDLSSVRLIASTGSPLVPESFDFVYQHIKQDVQLASIAGGTDIIGCFVCGNPNGPVWRGEIQVRALAMDVQVFDEDGGRLVGEQGELVCCSPFPSMPIGFWNDTDGARYHSAYFDHFANIWCHGDWVALTERGGMVMYGRSDAVLNPGGVRIGTAEIYRQVEQLEEVVESIAIGQRWDDDVRVVLFVVLRPDQSLDQDLETRIRQRIFKECSPRHVPAKILQVTDIPRTKSGKITEIAVRKVVHGEEIRNREALANPEALDLYRDLAELRLP